MIRLKCRKNIWNVAMRILITSVVDPNATAHNRLHHFISSLSKGNDLTVVAVRDTWKAKSVTTDAYPESSQSFMKGVRTHYMDLFQRPTWQEMSSILRMKTIMERIGTRDFDLHINYNTILMGNSARTIASLRGEVFDLADDLIEMIRESTQISRLLSPIAARAAKGMIKRSIAKSNVVTSISRTLLKKYDVPEEKSLVIPNGVDIDTFVPSDGSKTRGQLGIPSSSFVIGYVGVLREWTDLQMVLKVVSKIHKGGGDARLLVAGEEGGIDDLLASATRLGVRKQVISVGTVPYSTVPTIINATDLCVIPFKVGGIAEGAVPLKLFEYMSCGKLVVSTRSPSIYEHVGDNILYADSWEELLRQVKKAMEDQEELNEFMENGRRLVHSRYSWQRIEGQIRSVVDSFLKTGTSEEELR